MTVSDKPLYIIVDGNSFLYRAFHSLPPLTNRDGEPTGAITGVLNMITSIQKNFNPEVLVITFDAKGKNFRHDIFPEYKANRTPMPDDLRSQVQPLKDILAAWGQSIISVADVEADDTMCTLAIKAKAAGYTAIMATSDKDMRQIVSEDILILDTKTISDNGMPFGVEGVIDKEGVPPELIRDKLALMGDKVDNIPGVSKCGEKTAVKWLAEYGSMQGVIDNSEKVGGKIGEYLREGLTQLPISYELVTIDTNVPIPDDFSGTYDEAALDILIKRYSLNNFKKNISFVSSTALVFEEEYTITNDLSDFTANSAALDTMIVDRCEHQGEIYYAAYTPLNKQFKLFNVSELKQLTSILERCSQLFTVNLKNTLKELPSELLQSITVHDMKIADYSIDGISDVSSKEITIEQLNNKYVSGIFSDLRDVYKLNTATPKLDKANYEEFTHIIAEELCLCSEFFKENLNSFIDLESYKDDMKLAFVLSSMEKRGIRINARKLQEHSVELSNSIQLLEDQIYAIAGQSFNIESPKQVGNILYNVLEIPSKKKTTAEDHLLTLVKDNPIVQLIMSYRSLAKLRSTFVEGLLSKRTESDDLHTTFNQVVTSTGRLSSTDPNLQNIPIRSEEGKRVRDSFCPRPDLTLIALDYSQIEIRILAHLSQDPVLINAFNQNVDIHTATAAEVLGIPLDDVTVDERRSAKATNFGLIYGMGSKKLAKELGITVKEAKDYIQKYFARFACIEPYFDNQLQFARNNLYVETHMGRKLSRSNINTTNKFALHHVELSAKNASIQGTAADIIKKAMIACYDAIKGDDDIHMLLQVHDELLFEVEESKAEETAKLLQNIMENVVNLLIPLKVDYGVGNSWLEAH
jgi:DNA polymerase-1